MRSKSIQYIYQYDICYLIYFQTFLLGNVIPQPNDNSFLNSEDEFIFPDQPVNVPTNNGVSSYSTKSEQSIHSYNNVFLI